MQARSIQGSQTRRRLIWGVGLVLALAVVSGTIEWFRLSSAHANPSYVTATLSRGTIARSVSATGTVNPQLTIIVGSYVSGVIQELSCDFNTRVKKGQVCATIDPRPYQTAVDQASAELGTARAQLVKDQAALDYASATYRRNAMLAKKGFITQDLTDSAQSAMKQAEAVLELDQALIRQREASLKAANVNLEYTRIVSPVDGTVVARNVTIGQTVAASFQTPTLFLIATDLTQMQVDTNVSEGDVGGLKIGDPAQFTVEAFPSRVFSGEVTQIRQAPQTVQNVVTYDVIVTVANDDLVLKPGMTATTRIITEQLTDVLRIPDQALRFSPTRVPSRPDSGGHFVWVLRKGQAQAVRVDLGLDDDTYTEYRGGDLKADDAIIVGEQKTEDAKNSPRVRFGL